MLRSTHSKAANDLIISEAFTLSFCLLLLKMVQELLLEGLLWNGDDGRRLEIRLGRGSERTKFE